MSADVTINEEYEKLYGTVKSINLFESDEEYKNLRQYIINQPNNFTKSNSLPFDDIKLTPYNEYMWLQEIESAINHGKRVFYIRQNQPYCKAACYFDTKSGSIVLLKYSYIVDSNDFSFNDFSQFLGRKDQLNHKSHLDNKGLYITENIKCLSPLVAASYVLGRKADLTEWRDENGISIVTYYSALTRLIEQELKKKGKDREERQKGKRILELLNGIAIYLANKVPKHIFYIEEEGVCSASGYLEEDSKQFFIMKGSLVSMVSDILYDTSQSGKARARFLDMVCVLKSHYYYVSKNAKCRSASAAACYVLGRKDDFTAWRDKDGKTLEEIYPDRFFVPHKESSPLPLPFAPDEPPLFHIMKTDDAMRYCKAYGTYDSAGNHFLIMKDSVLSLDVSSSYRYTAADYQRQKFIKLNCTKKTNGFVLNHDVLCDSPSAAASYVLGRSANGWLEWKDDSNRTLKEVYNH